MISGVQQKVTFVIEIEGEIKSIKLKKKSKVGMVDDKIKDNAALSDLSYFFQYFSYSLSEITYSNM